MPDDATTDRIERLVEAAVTHDDRSLLVPALEQARSSRDRQLVALAAAHLDRDDDLFDALVRDHLADHPDSVLAARIATRHRAGSPAPRTETRTETGTDAGTDTGSETGTDPRDQE